MYKLIIADADAIFRGNLLYRINWNELGFLPAKTMHDGERVLDYLRDNDAQVLLVDVHLPKISGLELARIIRKKYPHMQVILMSSERDFETVREAVRCRVYEFVLKTGDYDQLKPVFLRLRMELEASAGEDRLLSDCTEEEYALMLEVVKALSKPDSREDEQTWLSYARLKPLMHSAPAEVRKLLAGQLWQLLKRELVHNHEEVAEILTRKATQALPADGEQTQQPLLWLLQHLKMELQQHGLAFHERVAVDDSIILACQYIQEHLGERFTYRDVADHIHISPRHFIRRFHSEMDETFTDYVVRLRVQTAMELLSRGMSPAEVPEAVGYRDEKYFGKLFREQAGCTLREFQRREQTSAATI